jgi:hypothetical protein
MRCKILLSLVLLTSSALAEPPQPRRPLGPVATFGLASLGLGYGAAIALSYTSASRLFAPDTNTKITNGYLLIPFAGPLLAAADTQRFGGRAVFNALAVVQISGAAATVIGLVIRAYDRPGVERSQAISWTPTVGPGSLGVVGAF